MKQLTKSDLIHAWNTYVKHNSPHPCKMPTPKAEAGRLLLVYGDKALQHVIRQAKHTNFSSEVVCYLTAVGLPAVEAKIASPNQNYQ